ncbi:Beta-hexosaminidase [Pseudoalteromonas luteoviolacea B = ATCC 29581]|nr:Beta-hexosaminidase [Pseudoalteromonas luteoviolacea B = ATCC 29581]
MLCMSSVLLFGSKANSNTIDKLALQLKVEYELIDAAPDKCPLPHKTCYFSKLHLSFPEDLRDNQWRIYFSQLMPIYKVESPDFDIEHVNGDLHRISPKPGFLGFKAGQALEIPFYTQGSQITRSEFMPNYLVAAANSTDTAQVIKSTQTQKDLDTGFEIQPYLHRFDSLKQLHVGESDKTPWMGSAYLHQTIVKPKATPEQINVIPKPWQAKLLSAERISLQKGYTLHASNELVQQLGAAKDYLGELGVDEQADGIPVLIEVVPSGLSYELNVSSKRINITANSVEGAFQGMMTLAAMLDLNNVDIPFVNIKDKPRYEFRGFHLDVARNFRSKSFVKELIQQMAAHKLNRLHLHLADDEGWRIDIADLPELVGVGSKRCFDLREQRCLLPQLGSGLAEDNPNDGYFTQQDYIDILRYAQAHFIEVIPSLDMPGHSRAAIKAMEARYQRLDALGEIEPAAKYRLVEPSDTTIYSSIQHYSDNTLNVCLPSTYQFIDKVLSEIQRLHEIAGVPLKTYHIGADETAGAWVNSPACQALRESNPSITYLNGYFIEQVSQMVAKRGIHVAAWSDGLSHTNVEKMPTQVQTNIWSTLSEGGHATAHAQANLGWDVVLSAPDVTYFDFPYESHPQERGNHWATRAISTKKVFEFMPENLPAHAEFWVDVKGQTYQADDRETTRKKANTYRGIQGHLWGEMIRSDEQAQYMIFPRLFALAERAWHQPSWAVPYVAKRHYHRSSGFFDLKKQTAKETDWQRFASILGYSALPKLAKQGVYYRIPSVAAAPNRDGKLSAYALLPGFSVQVQLQNGQWQAYSPRQDSKDVIAVRAIDSVGRAGRSLPIDENVKH